MEFRRNEPLLRGLAAFVPGVICLLYSLLVPYEPDGYVLHFAFNLFLSLIFLGPGTVLIVLFLTGKIKAPTKFPLLSKLVITIIVSVFSVLTGILLLFFFLNPVIVGPLLFSIFSWMLLANTLLLHFEQKKAADASTNNTEDSDTIKFVSSR